LITGDGSVFFGDAEPMRMILRTKLRTFVSCLGLVACVFAVFGQVASHDFVAYDSAQYITNNPHVLSGLSWKNVEWAFTSSWSANWHPLTWISHMLDVQLFGLEPAWHQLENVHWHALNSVLLFLVFQRMTKQWGKSLFVAALFALHPLHVESVAWIVERKDLLSTFFGLLCFACYARFAERPSIARYLGVIVFLALGLLSKPMLVTWPCLLLLLDLWPLGRSALGARRLFVEKLPLFALSAGSCIATVVAQRAGGAVQSLTQLSLDVRLENALAAYATYVGNTIWPAKLAIYYPLRATELGAGELTIGAALVAGLSILAWREMRRRAYLFTGWFFFLGALVPVIGIVQVGGQALADRYTYVPAIGLFVIAAWGGEELCARIASGSARAPITATNPERGKRLALASATIACVALAIVAWRQVGTWRDTETVSEHALAVTEENHVAHNLLGMSLVDRGRMEDALEQFREALRIAPGDVDALDNYGAALTRVGRFDEAEAQFRKGLSLAPSRANLHHHLGMALQSQGHYEEALVYLSEAVRLSPEYAAAHTSRGQVLEQLGRNDEARAAYEHAIAARPNYVPALMSLARLLARTNDQDGAAVVLTRAVAIDPSNAEIHRGLARAYTARSRSREALAELELALRLRPDWPVAQADLAWLLATASDPAVRDVKRAIDLGERASRASGERAPTVLDALAAAYAAGQRFAEARATADKALARAKEMGDTELAAKIDRRLAAYRENRIDPEQRR
jgi:Flp pilus assembly protein TadD